MLTGERVTLTQFLIGERRRFPDASGEFNDLITNLVLVCKTISKAASYGSLAGILGDASSVNVHGEAQKKLDVIANRLFLRRLEWGGCVAGMASEEMAEHYDIPDGYSRGKYLLLFDPLDGSSNTDINVSVGSIFSVLRAPNGDARASAEDFLQSGTEQMAAGYAIYGPATMLVLTVGTGTHGFTLDPQIGEFIVTHPELTIPSETQEFAINASNERFWEAPVKRYVSECLAGSSGPRGKDFNMRWIASLVAEVHRILMRGGLFMYPRDSRDPTKPGRLRLLYEASPMAMVIEQAGGRASTGSGPLLDVVPTDLHQRVPVILGSSAEVQRIEHYQEEHSLGLDEEYRSPLFNTRSLFTDGG